MLFHYSVRRYLKGLKMFPSEMTLVKTDKESIYALISFRRDLLWSHRGSEVTLYLLLESAENENDCKKA